MKPVVRDLMILAGICLVAWGITWIQVHYRQLERKRAALIYDSSVDYDSAVRLMDTLEEIGLLSGAPRTFKLGRTQQVFELLVVVDPSVVANPQTEKMLKEAFKQVCAASFPGETAMVKFANPKLESFHLLVEPTAF